MVVFLINILWDLSLSFFTPPTHLFWPVMTSAEPPLVPPQVLMIHGYRQNATSCREKSGAFRKLTKRHLEPVFVSAPLVVPPRADGSTPGRAN